MSVWRVLALGVAVPLMSVAWSARAGVFDAATLADYSGEELFAQFCASCHGERARGDGPVAASLNKVVPDLTAITIRYGEFPSALVRDTIDGRSVPVSAHGTREMPVWGYEFWVEEGADITAETAVRDAINRLVDYLRSLQREESRGQRAEIRR